MNRNLFVTATALLALMGGQPEPAAAAGPNASAAAQSHTPDYREQIMDWRQRRYDRLKSESGWLTLVALEWLQDGRNRVGSGGDADIHIPGGPEYWGDIYVEGDKCRFVPAKGAPVEVNGAPAREIDLVADVDGEPTIVSSGTLSWYVIFRESYAVRVKDSQAPTRVQFEGVDYYPIDPSWRIEGRFTTAPEGETIEIGNVLGQLSDTPVFGTFEFERDGQSFSLVGVREEGTPLVWFLFADPTNGRETYGAGRFLYSDDVPEDGRLVVDFNKAYNPPCAFNHYSTCPIPPQENRFAVPVRAGEKMYHHD
ncbi:MAG: DUF1684 domain-containing protein [Lysobacterales bacterium]|jgi:uncharacterized protein (DUF1684 family)